MDVINPSTLDVITSLEMSADVELEEILRRAQSFFKDKSSCLAVEERIAYLRRFKQLILDNRVRLIQESLSEGGKPYKDTIGEFDRAVNGVELAIEYLSLIHI